MGRLGIDKAVKISPENFTSTLSLVDHVMALHLTLLFPRAQNFPQED